MAVARVVEAAKVAEAAKEEEAEKDPAAKAALENEVQVEKKESATESSKAQWPSRRRKW